jgi:hypothetical protein
LPNPEKTAENRTTDHCQPLFTNGFEAHTPAHESISLKRLKFCSAIFPDRSSSCFTSISLL